MRALDPHTRRASLSSGVEAAHSAKNLMIVMVKMSMNVLVYVSMITVMMGMFIMVKMFMMTVIMMDTFEFLAALLQMHWADSKL